MKKKLLALFLTVLMLFSVVGCSAEAELNEEQAIEKLEALYGSIEDNVTVVEHQPDPGWLDESVTVQELPPINNYPLTVQGNGDINVEIFTSTEKTDWMNQMAQEFNGQNLRVDGKTASISIRPIASGAALDYIVERVYVPDVYTPANVLWGEMIASKGVQSELIIEKLTGNVAGILMEKKIHESYVADYGEVTFGGVVDATLADDLVLGHTNPFLSSTGLNVSAGELRSCDPDNPFSPESIEKFRQFQSMIPPASPTTAEMVRVGEEGILNAMIMEAQAYADTATLQDWEFTPVGVRHDSPVYALDNLEPIKKEVLGRFVEFCLTPESQQVATSMGFNQYEGYVGAENEYTGAELFSFLQVWKENKDGGRPIISVFVVDRSGSMQGDKLNRVKVALNNSLQYINEGNYIGLVSYSSASDITIDLQIEEFTPRQRALFAGAIRDIEAANDTATYDAVVVAMKMARDAQEEVPNSKIRILILSDGQRTDGMWLSDVTGMVHGIELPVYGVGFEAQLGELEELARINEGYTIDADSEDVIYKLRNLFTAEL